MAKIKLFITDCDGCMTDGGMYYDNLGNEWKKFNARDGMGFEMLRNSGVLTGIISSENTPLLERRATKLKIDEFHQGAKNKPEVLAEILQRTGIDYSEVAYLGDDINDLKMMDLVGLTFCPNDAMKQIQPKVDVVLTKKGGEGAVREAAEYVIELNDKE